MGFGFDSFTVIVFIRSFRLYNIVGRSRWFGFTTITAFTFIILIIVSDPILFILIGFLFYSLLFILLVIPSVTYLILFVVAVFVI